MQVILSFETSTFLLIDHVIELVSIYQYPDYMKTQTLPGTTKLIHLTNSY